MKKLLFITIFASLLASCTPSVTSEVSSSNSVSSSISSSISEISDDSSISIDEEKEYYSFDKNESKNRLVLRAINNKSTAYSSFEALYEEKGVRINIEFADEDIYADNIYNIGFDDNIEFLINMKTNSSGWVPNGTYHFLMNADGKVFFEVASTSTTLGTSMNPNLKVVLGENLDYDYTFLTEEDYGFDGFKASVFIHYEFFSENYESVKGNLSFCPGMRNSHDYLNDTTWSAYSSRGCKWANSSTFVCINADGTFGEKFNLNLDNLFIGDTHFDLSNWKTFKNDIYNTSSLNTSISGSNIAYWNEEISFYTNSSIKNIIVYLGTNDIKEEKMSISQIKSSLSQFFKVINDSLKNTNIYYVSLVPTNLEIEYVETFKLINDFVKNDNIVNYIDITTSLIDETTGVSREGITYSNGKFNYLGYNLIKDVIVKELNITASSLGEQFGRNSRYSSSSSFSVTPEGVVNTGGDDQYLICKNEPRNSIDFTLSISAKEVFNADPYPKFGLILMSENKTLFFYIDGSNALTTRKVGYVEGLRNTTWNWPNSIEKTIDNLTYSNGAFAKLSILYDGNNVIMKVNDAQVLTCSKMFNGEALTVGVLTFNTSIIVK